MQEDYRPNPDDLLKRIKSEEDRRKKGKLKIFFGMCAGVGKTYAMLRAARMVKKDGLDVVIGYVETHKRKETEEQLRDLEIIPRQVIDYKGTQFEEMDINAILERNPQIVLVDELAHTNIEGSRHNKRYQDVMEILDNGIDVYTTVNVQHIESRSNTVNEITGIQIHEKVPDSIIDLASEIELIDLPADDLIKRLSEGKVYISEKAAQATQHFFRKGNLHALRELALRVTAEKVDNDLTLYKQDKNISESWKTAEKLLVAVGPSPYSAKLIQWTRRMAYNLGAQWFAVCVETGLSLSDQEKNNLNKNIELAERLGATIIHTSNTDVVLGVLQIARENNVSQIVIGKTLHLNKFKSIWKENISNRLIQESGNIDVYVVKADKSIGSFPKQASRFHFLKSYNDYFIALLTVCLLSLICFPFTKAVGYQTIGLVYLLEITILSLFLGSGAVIFTAILNSIAWNYFFIPPLFTFHVERLEDILTLIFNFVIALVVSVLITRTRKFHSILKINQQHSSIIRSLLESLNKTTSIKDVVLQARNELQKSFSLDAVVYLKEKGDSTLEPNAFGNTDILQPKDLSVAFWTFNNNKQAGKFTDTLSDANLQFHPLSTNYGIIGVIGIHFSQDKKLSFETQAILKTVIGQVALSLEREINNDLKNVS